MRLREHKASGGNVHMECCNASTILSCTHSSIAEEYFSTAMEECRRNVTVWMKSRRSHVEPLHSILWRVKNVTRIGETIRGFPDGEGQLVQFEWDNVLGRFPPCIIEVCCNNAPLSALLNALSLLPQETVRSS